MISIPKKTNDLDCADHRIISFIDHASKVLHKIVLKGFKRTQIFHNQSSYHFEFEKGSVNGDAIKVMTALFERSLKFWNAVYVLCRF